MKKIFLSLITVAALLMCSCEKENVTPGGGGGTNPDQPVIDITPYLGKYLMTRHTDLSISVLNMFTFPLDRDLDVEVVTIKKDPAVQHGLIITNNDALYLRGVVDTSGLHLQNDTISINIDTTIASVPVKFGASVSMTHPVIQPPVTGIMEWTSIASGSASTSVLGMPVSATITGNMLYKTVISNN